MSSHRKYASASAAVLLTLALGAPAGLGAQVDDPLTPGARVRVKRPDLGSKWQQGTLVILSPDSATMALAGGIDTLRFSRDTLGRFEWSRGVRARTGKGALLGLGIGAGAGLLLGVAASAEDCTGFCPAEVGPGEITAVAAILGGIGAGVGALITR
jgi:hypothetical protein